MHMQVPLGRQRSEGNLNRHPSGTISSSLWDRVSPWMGMHQTDIMVCQQVQRVFRSLIPQGWNYKCIPPYLTFNMSSGNWTQALLLERQALSGWVISQPEIDLGQWHNVLQTGHLKTKPFQGVSVHRVSFLKICTYFHCVYACCMCMYLCRCGHPLLFEVRGRGWVSCSLTLCLIPMRQVLSLSLEPSWPPASPRDPSVSVPPGTGIAAACPAMPSCVCLFLRF